MQCEQPTCEFGVLSCVFVWRFVYMTCCTFAVVSFIFVTHANAQHTTTKRYCPHQMHDARRPLNSYQRDESFRISQFFHEIHPGGTINSLNASWWTHQWNCVTSYETPFWLVLTSYLVESHDAAHRCVNETRPTALLSHWSMYIFELW